MNLTVRPLLHPVAGAAVSGAVLAALTLGLAPTVDEDAIVNVTLVYLLVVLVASAVWGYAVGLLSAAVADLLVNFFFVPPIHTFTVHRPANALALGIFLAVATIGASMLALLRTQLQNAEARRREADLVLAVSREGAIATSPRAGMERVCDAIARSLGARACSIVAPPGWQAIAGPGVGEAVTRDEKAMAEAAFERHEVVRAGSREGAPRIAGAQRGDAPNVAFVPFPADAPAQGALRISGQTRPPGIVDTDRLLEAFATEASLAVHRARLADEARNAEALRRADEMKSALLASVSHDLRSPLAAIQASVDSLRDDSVAWPDEDRKLFLDTIASQSERLTRTVTGLLEMSRLEGGAVAVKLEPVNAGQLLNEIRIGSAATAAGHPIEVSGAEEAWIRADYALLSQALQNLVANAVAYSIPGGRITLACREAGHRVRLEVSDEGPGIPPTDLPHIFEKFYRGASSSGKAGSGLGLSIVKAMVELCGGSIAVTSAASGTTFGIELARAATP